VAAGNSSVACISRYAEFVSDSEDDYNMFGGPVFAVDLYDVRYRYDLVTLTHYAKLLKVALPYLYLF
jgi:hypothetical protein